MNHVIRMMQIKREVEPSIMDMSANPASVGAQGSLATGGTNGASSCNVGGLHPSVGAYGNRRASGSGGRASVPGRRF
jgi:hypothetical protein